MQPDTAYIVAPIILLVLALRIWLSGGTGRRVRIETMWIAPLIFVLLIGSGIAAQPPPLSPLVIGVLAIALALGLGLGWFRGRTVAITIDPENHTLTSKQSALGLVILAGIFLARAGVRMVLRDHMVDWHISPAALTDSFLLMALGSVVGRRIEILIRCLRLLAQAKADKAAGKTVPMQITEDHA